MFDKITSIYAPHSCVGCECEGGLLCTACRNRLQLAAGRCFGCGCLNEENRTCVKCRRASRLYGVTAAVEYGDTAKQLVYRLKFYGTRAAASVMAALMAENAELDDDALLVYLPTATGRLRQRGYDHALLLSRNLSRITGLACVGLLARTGQARQVGASRRQRLIQPRGSYMVKNERLVRGKKIILVDDVMTTGASLSAAAEALKQAGAKRVEAVVFARA